MSKLLLSLVLSAALHSFIFIEFSKEDISSDLPKGKTNLATVLIKNIKIIPSSSNKSKLNTNSKKIKHVQNEITKKKQAAIQSKYLTMVKKKIEENKVFPFSAKTMGIEGKVEVELTIMKNGEFSIYIAKKSTNEVFNQAVNDLFSKIKIFEPLPKGENSMTVSIPIWYQSDV